MNYTNLTDDELAVISKNDTLAEEELFSRYKKIVRQISRSYFITNGDDEDLLQEAMIGLHSAIVSYDKEQGSFHSFANLCIKRRLLSAVKLSNSHKNKMFNNSISLNEEGGINNSDGECIFIVPSTDPSPDENLKQKEDYKKLQNYINENLSKYEKKVLNLYLAGLSYSEIAFSLKTTSKSVENALSRLRLKILKYSN